jgi:hypothetical protein
VPDPGPELSSITTQVEELTRKVTAIADVYNGGERDDIAIDLYDVERNLRAAARRLNRVRSRL